MLLIKNGYIKPIVGTDIPCGCVLIGDNGKIAAVGENIAAPEGAQVLDAQGRLVTPGCVDAHCHIGLAYHNKTISFLLRIINNCVHSLFRNGVATYGIVADKTVGTISCYEAIYEMLNGTEISDYDHWAACRNVHTMTVCLSLCQG